LAFGSHDRLRMKLYALKLQLPMTQAHNVSLGRRSRNLQTRRQSVPFNHQGMITTCLETVFESLENRFAVMTNFRRLAVHQNRRPDHSSTKNLRDCLMAQADAQHW